MTDKATPWGPDDGTGLPDLDAATIARAFGTLGMLPEHTAEGVAMCLVGACSDGPADGQPADLMAYARHVADVAEAHQDAIAVAEHWARAVAVYAQRVADVLAGLHDGDGSADG